MTKTKKLTVMAMLIALSVVLVLIIKIPIIPPLEYDAGDIPILIGGFLLGPVPGLIITLIASVVQGLTVSAATGPWGILMHFLATGAFVLVASLFYQHNKTRKNAAIGILLGALTMAVIMMGLNLVIMPLWGIPLEQVKSMMFPVIAPFNLLKAGINGLVTFILYKPISNLIKIEKLPLKKKEANS
ncbi:MAG: ECF transporter S component [Oscillospiraceae bacterium]